MLVRPMTSRDVRNTLARDAAVSRYITLAITLAITLETLGITTRGKAGRASPSGYGDPFSM